MAAPVPYKRTNPRYQDAVISGPVRGRTMRDLGELLHWVRGHGMHVIPCCSPHVKLEPSETVTLRWRVHPSGQAIARVWHVCLRGEEPSAAEAFGRVTLTYPDGFVQHLSPFYAMDVFQALPGYFHVEELGAKSAALTELTVDVEHIDGDTNVWIESITCWELPRAVLTQDATDRGVDLETLRSGQPIYEGTNRSYYPLALGWANTTPRRSLAQINMPVTVVFSTGSFVDLFRLPVPIQPSKIGRTMTQRTITWDVYARVTNADTTGELRLTLSESGDTDVIAFTPGNTSFAWRGTSTALAECEDVTTADGLQGGNFERMQVAGRRTAGTGNVEIEVGSAISVWEAP